MASRHVRDENESGQPSITDALEELVKTFHDLNTSQIDELREEPSPLEFMRYVSRNTPFVVRGGAASWKATQLWNAEYLKMALSGQTVNVAVTPNGYADAPMPSGDGQKLVLAKPYEESQMFHEFLSYIMGQETDPNFPPDSEVRYAQTQNDNFRDEYSPLLPDAPNDIPFARIALQKHPEAVNLWIGNSKSVTATHKDNFENIFVQIVGRKHFVLLPPHCQPCVNETPLEQATYVREQGRLCLCSDRASELVPFALWDPDFPNNRATSFSHLAVPFRVTLEPGDMLYLPAMW